MQTRASNGSSEALNGNTWLDWDKAKFSNFCAILSQHTQLTFPVSEKSDLLEQLPWKGMLIFLKSPHNLSLSLDSTLGQIPACFGAERANLFFKDQINSFSFVSHIHVTTTQLCYFSAKAAIDNTHMNGHGCDPILYLLLGVVLRVCNPST
jgi:hypothetical protein